MVAGSLAVAGCGGGGGGAPTPPAAELTAAQKAVNAARQAVGAARTAVNGITPASARGQVEAAGKALADAETGIGNLLKADRAQFAADMRTLTERLDLADRLAAVDAVADARAKAGMETVDIAVTAMAIMEAKEAIAMLPAGDRAAYTAQLSGSEKALADARAAMDLEERRTMQTNALTAASTALAAALGTLDADGDRSTSVQFAAAIKALGDLERAIAAAMDLTDGQKAGYQAEARLAKARNLETRRVAAVSREIRATEIKAAGTAVGKVMDASDEATVTAANAGIAAAKAAIAAADIPDADRERLRTALAVHEGMLKEKMTSRTAAMKAEAKAVHAGIARYDDADDLPRRRHAGFSDNERTAGLDPDATLNISIGKADAVRLKRDKAAMVAALKGWTGSRYTLESGGATYEAVVYDNRYSAPNDPFHIAWREKLNKEGANGWVEKVNEETQDVTFDGLDPLAGINTVGEFGESYRVRGTFQGVSGEFLCRPGGADRACAIRKTEGATLLGDTNRSLQFSTRPLSNNNMEWRFKPDNANDRVKTDDDSTFVTYGYWIRKGADGRWDVSAFHNATRGDDSGEPSGLAADTLLSGKATYGGAAAGVYALSDGAGTFTADAELVADFTGTSDSVTGTIDGFMTRGFTGGGSMSRDWSVELQKRNISDKGRFTENEGDGVLGLTRWTMDGEAGRAGGKWTGAFYDRGGAGLLPKAATGSFYAEHGLSSRVVGAFGVTDPNTDEPLE